MKKETRENKQKISFLDLSLIPFTMCAQYTDDIVDVVHSPHPHVLVCCCISFWHIFIAQHGKYSTEQYSATQ